MTKEDKWINAKKAKFKDNTLNRSIEVTVSKTGDIVHLCTNCKELNLRFGLNLSAIEALTLANFITDTLNDITLEVEK
jgi:hypothetical protein